MTAEIKLRRLSGELAQLRIRMMEIELDFGERFRRLEDEIITCKATMIANEQGESEVSIYSIIRSLMAMHFNRAETKAILFDLGISSDKFGSDDLGEMQIKLIEHCRHHEIMDDFIDILKRSRPRVSWPDI